MNANNSGLSTYYPVVLALNAYLPDAPLPLNAHIYGQWITLLDKAEELFNAWEPGKDETHVITVNDSPVTIATSVLKLVGMVMAKRAGGFNDIQPLTPAFAEEHALLEHIRRQAAREGAADAVVALKPVKPAVFDFIACLRKSVEGARAEYLATTVEMPAD